MGKDLTNLLAAIEARAEKATPGPWENEDDRIPGAELPWRSTGLIWQKDDQSYQKSVCRIEAHKLAAHSPEEEIAGFEANADFIAHARTDIPRLIKALKKCREQRDEALEGERLEREIRFGAEYRPRDSRPEFDAELLAILTGSEAGGG